MSDPAELPSDQLISLRAKALLAAPTLDLVFGRLKEDYARDILNSAPDDLQTREIAYQRARALQEIRADLESLASNASVNAYNRRLRRT